MQAGREKALGPEHPSFAESLNNLAVLYENMGNYELAWQSLHQAMNSSSMLTLQHRFDQAWLDSLTAASYPPRAKLEKHYNPYLQQEQKWKL